MSFATPVMLLGLAVVPALVVLYVRHERRATRARRAMVADTLLPSLTPGRARWRRHVPVAAQAVALSALIVALAKPQATVAVPVEQATVVVATDRSGSMLARDVAPDRLTAARTAAERFLAEVPDDIRVGAIAFNHAPTVLSSPTRDHDAVRAALRSVRAAGSTATGDALAAALQLIRDASRERRGAPAAVVLVSDGKSVRGRDLMSVAEEARRAKVAVYTVALGTPTGTIGDGQLVPPDPAAMRAVAERTGGKAFTVAEAGELTQLFERLGSELAEEDREEELSSYFAGGALLLLFTGVALSTRWFGRPV